MSDKITCLRNDIGATIPVPDSLLVELESGTDVTLRNLDHVITEFSDTLYRTAFSQFGRKRNTVTKGVKHTQTDPWLDEHSEKARNAFCHARNIFKRYPTEENRHLFTTNISIYNRVKWKAKYRYKVEHGNNLCSVAKTNPKMFWKKITQIKGSKVSSNDALFVNDFFAHVNSVLGSTLDDMHTLDSEASVQDNDLDSLISIDEFISAICKLKQDKSAGIDSLVSEIFTETADILCISNSIDTGNYCTRAKDKLRNRCQ
jgi:hypothetical protein